MDLANLFLGLLSIAALTLALVLEFYKSMGKRRHSIEEFEVIALNFMGWGLISLSGVLLGMVIMRSVTVV